MDFDRMTREELIRHIKELEEYMDNVVVFWGGKREFRNTFQDVARNEAGEYTQQEATNAAVILGSQGAFDEFIQLVRDSFEKGGINYVVSEKLSTLMEEVASRHGKDQ